MRHAIDGGSSFPYSSSAKEERPEALQIDIDARMLSIRYPMELNLVGDSAETLQALIPFLGRKLTFLGKKLKEIQEWWKVLEGRR